MKRIPRRNFMEKFKQKTIKLVTEQGLTLAEAGRKLDVAKSCYPWNAGKVVPPRKLEDMRLLVAHRQLTNAGVAHMSKEDSGRTIGQGIVAGLNRIRRLRTPHVRGHAKIGNLVPDYFANRFYASRQQFAA